MKALEILRDNYMTVVSDTDTEMALYYQDHIQIVIRELEELENRNCNNCKKQETLMCPVTSFDGNIEDFSCNRWESKC